MNLGEYRPIVGRRSGVGSSDSLYNTIDDAVNGAIRTFTRSLPAGWDWLWQDVTVPLVTDTVEYPLGDIEALLTINAAVTPMFPILSVRSATRVIGDARSDFEKAARVDLERGACVRGWNVEGRILRVRPTPTDDETSLLLRVVVGERRLVDDGDTPLLPETCDEAIVHLARSIVYEAKQDDERSLAARKQYEQELVGIRSLVLPMGQSTPMPSA